MVDLQHQDFQPGFDRSQWSFDLSDIALQGNTEYWMGLRNTDAAGDYTDSRMYWMSSVGVGLSTPASQYREPGGEWTENHAIDTPGFSDGNRLTLGIYGDPITTTPEPETFALLGMGLVTLIPIARRRVRRG